MAIKLIVDSASDIYLEYARKENIEILPMTVIMDSVEYVSCFELTASDFYKKLTESEGFPATSQITPNVFEETFRKAIEMGDTPIAITISSKLSGTYQSACLAAKEFDGKAFVVDSLSASAGEAILTYYAVDLVKKGYSAEKIVAELETAKKKIRLFGMVDTLEYLKKGGRISAATALVGGILSIKPILSVTDGEIKSETKAKGNKNGYAILNEMIDKVGGIDFERPFSFAYAGLDKMPIEKYIHTCQAMLTEHMDNIPILEIGPVIGTHTGPGTIVIAFFDKN